ncbi:MAG: hypothetical protein GEV09_26865, partial [Pseudonocardiaceae bacterium]|nr:hypothetical protein [Pseudonocardiaceae bacterium]
RLVRIIANVEVAPSERGLDVRSNFRVLEYRRQVTYDWTGSLEHSLVPHGGELKIVNKKCLLINNSGDLPLLSFLL